MSRSDSQTVIIILIATVLVGALGGALGRIGLAWVTLAIGALAALLAVIFG